MNNDTIAQADHPLLPLIELAQDGLEIIDETVRDYQCIVVKQARVNGKVGRKEYMRLKVRHGGQSEDHVVPFSVYTRFLKPRHIQGQEAIWIEGRFDDKIVAHPPGMMNFCRLYLDPDGSVAMSGNRYSIRNIGMKNLVVKMLEKGQAGLRDKNCQARIERGVQIGDQSCFLLEILHPFQKPGLEFHIGRVYISEDFGLPVAYEGFLWPQEPGGELPLLEKYYYVNVELNVGLTDQDFDPDNEDYDFPARN